MDRESKNGGRILQLLLFVTLAEVSLNRLAVPQLAPASGPAPLWFVILDHAGRFFFYFASTLALGVVAHRLYILMKGDDRPHTGFLGVPGSLLAILGAVFVLLALANVVVTPTTELSFLFDTMFTVVLLLIAVDQLTSRGDVAVKVGVVVLALPLAVHYCVALGSEADEIHGLGKWSLVLAGLAAPMCFAPRPFVRSLIHPVPLVTGLTVGILGAVLLRERYAVGMEIASRGMGVDIGVLAPNHHLWVYLVALGAVTWAGVSCFIAHSPERRNIGFGIGLVVAGGYAFSWPLQYLVGIAGLLTISEAAKHVSDEESHDRVAPPVRSFRGPPIAVEAWQKYIGALIQALRTANPDDRPSTVTVKGDDDVSTTHIVSHRRGVPIQLRIERVNNSVLCIDVVCGVLRDDRAPPGWTLYAKPERLLGIHPHEEPPMLDASATKTRDEPFDLRFRVRDKEHYTDKLLDEELRARTTALIDGWLVYWPSTSLQYHVFPGRGAPLDHPIPITELAFRGTSVVPAADRLVSVVDLLVEIAIRGGISKSAHEPAQLREPDLDEETGAEHE